MDDLKSTDEQLTYEKYIDQFKGFKKAKALERAWKNRDFEIEMYWKRANYFWAFITTAFAGYFIILSQLDDKFAQAELLIACIGFIFSYGWFLVNMGSKKWQENWERHIDMLEEDVTGHLYKSVLDKTSFSVSGINQVISGFVTTIWFLLLIYYFREKNSIGDITMIETTLLLVTIFFSRKIHRKRKESPIKVKKGDEKISFSKRGLHYREE